MQIAVQNNTIVATYDDAINTMGLHPDCVWRRLPDGFKYPVAIPDTIMENGTEYPINRRVPAAGDPDPITNTVNIPEILLRKKYLAEQASKECQERIEYINGETRYQTIKQNSFTDILMYCKEWLTDNPDATPEEKAPYEDRITKIESVRVWIRGVLNYYYEIQTAILAADEAGLAAVTWDYSQFEATDPGVTLEEVRLV